MAQGRVLLQFHEGPAVMSFAVEEDPAATGCSSPSRSSGPVTPVRRSSSVGGSSVWRVTACTWA